MGKITNITIKNIKGYGDPAHSIDLELRTDRVNILHAPNGSGKTSLATAFKSLLPKSLNVNTDDIYKKDDTLDCELSITMDGTKMTANKSKNEIYPQITPIVINCGIVAATTNKLVPGYQTVTSGYIDIKDIIVKERIPEDIAPEYSVRVSYTRKS